MKDLPQALKSVGRASNCRSLAAETTPPTLTHSCTPSLGVGPAMVMNPIWRNRGPQKPAACWILHSEQSLGFFFLWESWGIHATFPKATPRYVFLGQDFPWAHQPLLLTVSQLVTVLWSQDVLPGLDLLKLHAVPPCSTHKASSEGRV